MINPIRILLAVIRAILMVLSITIYLIVYSVSLLFWKNTQKRAFRLRRNWLRLGSIILGLRTQVEGLENIPAHACLYVSNHRSLSDPFHVCRYIDAFMIAQMGLNKMPVLDYGFRLTGIIYVDRDDKDSRKQTRETLIQTIKSGYNVFVCPEGTTNERRRTRPFKPGTFVEAAKHGFDIVPVTIEYKYDRAYWRVGSLAKQFIREYGHWLNETKIKINPPIRSEDPEYLLNTTQSIINDNMLTLQKGWSQATFPSE